VLTAGSREWGAHYEVPLYEAVLWDIATGKRVQAYPSPKDAVRSLAFDVGGRRLTVGYGGLPAVTWDMNTGRPIDHIRQTTKKQGEASRADSDKRDQFDDDENSTLARAEYKSPDGRWTVRRTERNAVVLRDLQTSKETKILDYPLFTPIRAAFNANTFRIAVADADSVHIFDPVTAKQLATLYSLYGGRDWLVTTPGGVCTGSQGGLSLVRVRVGEAEYPLEHFQKQLNDPGMITKILQTKPKE
jgi:WD40 repeat protein